MLIEILTESQITYLNSSKEAIGLGRKLFPLFALALDLPEDFFEDKVSQTSKQNDDYILTILHHLSINQDKGNGSNNASPPLSSADRTT